MTKSDDGKHYKEYDVLVKRIIYVRVLAVLAYDCVPVLLYGDLMYFEVSAQKHIIILNNEKYGCLEFCGLLPRCYSR